MISNLSPQRAAQFTQKEFKRISIHAGYQDGHGIIFQGNIVYAISGRESPTDTLVTVWAADGDEGHNYGIVNTTHPPGSTPQQHFNTALAALGQYGITKGYIGVDLSTPTYPRAVTLFGMARDVLANIAKTKNASVSYQNEQVTMVPKGGSAPGGAIVLNSQTGLIGMPSQTIGGIFARCLVNPAIGIHSQVQINQGDIQGAQPAISNTGEEQITFASLPPLATDGLYTVYRIEKNGDTRGNDWYFDLQCLATNQPVGLGGSNLITNSPVAPLSGAGLVIGKVQMIEASIRNVGHFSPNIRTQLDKLYAEEARRYRPMLDAMLWEARNLRLVEGHKARERTLSS
jgi:hypothetical protein